MATPPRSRSEGLVIPVVAMAMLSALALLPMPYGYYQIMRVAACALSLWAAWRLWPLHEGLAALLAGFAVLYNPLLPVHLGSKALWAAANIATVVALGYAHHTLARANGSVREGDGS